MSFLQDIRYGLRMIVKAPAFTALAMLALALGVCANTTIFSLVNGILLRPLQGVKDPSTLVALYTSDYSSGLYSASSYPDYIDFREQADAFEDLAASERVEQVFVRHVFRYFLGRNEILSDGPVLVAAHRAYRESGGSLNALLISLLTSDSFLYRAHVK